MKVGITTSVIDSTLNKRGVANTVKYLIKHLNSLDENIDLNLIHFHENTDEIYQVGLNEIIIKPFKTPFNLFSKHLSNFLKTPKLVEELDIIHITNPFIYDFPLFFIKNKIKILTIYDTCYFLKNRPEMKNLFKRNPKVWLYHKLWKFLLPIIKDKIDMFISISDGTKQDMIKYLKIPEEKIKTIHLGADEIYRPISVNRTLEDYIPKGPFILTDRPHTEIAKIFYNLKKKGINHKLVGFSGREYVTKEYLEKLGIEKDVQLLGYVSKDHLLKLYNTADLYVRFVHFTGFGIPTVEAMACGCPVMVSNSDAGPEVVGDAGVLGDPYNPDEWTGKLYEILTNDSMRKLLSKKGLKRAEKFSWKYTANATFDVYEEIMRRENYE